MSKSYWNGSSTGYADDIDDRGPRRYAPRSATTALYDDAPEYRPEYTRGRGAADDTTDLGEPLDYDDNGYADDSFGDDAYDGAYDDDAYDADSYDEDHHAGGHDDGYAGDGYYYQTDNRWRWVAVIAAVVLLVAVIATAMALQSGDSSTATTTPTPTDEAQDAITSSQSASASAPPTSAKRSAAAATPAPGGLPAETVVTVPPSVSAHQNPDTPAVAEPADPATAPERTITYTVTGDRQLFDLVTVIYTDEQGFPRTDINVALPWTRTVVLNPGVDLKSVTATSVAGKLNCSISNGSGDTLVQQNAGTILAACTN